MLWAGGTGMVREYAKENRGANTLNLLVMLQDRAVLQFRLSFNG